MPIYEFQCAKGHVTEQMVPVGTPTFICPACVAEQRAIAAKYPNNPVAWNPLAKRILSPTRTNFVFADTGKRIQQIQQIAQKGL